MVLAARGCAAARHSFRTGGDARWKQPTGVSAVVGVALIARRGDDSKSPLTKAERQFIASTVAASRAPRARLTMPTVARVVECRPLLLASVRVAAMNRKVDTDLELISAHEYVAKSREGRVAELLGAKGGARSSSARGTEGHQGRGRAVPEAKCHCP